MTASKPGSYNLRRYIGMRRAGTPRESAAAMAGLSLEEATSWDADEAKGELGWIEPIKNPPPLTPDPTAGDGSRTAQAAREREEGAGETPISQGARQAPLMSGNAGTTTKETKKMGRPRKPKAEKVEVIAKPDFERAIAIYREDIRPAQAKVGEYAQEQSTAYKEIKKACNVVPGAAKLAFKLNEMEEAKRDEFLRSLYGLMLGLNIGISADLVDQMGDGEAPKMPVVQKQRPSLMTVN